MKYFSFILSITLFCLNSHPATATIVSPSAKHPVHKIISAQSPRGKLYLRYSIFRGLHLSWLFLGDDGTFVIDPQNGVDPINYTLERKNNAANVGSFTKSSTSVSARYDKGKTTTWKIEYLNGTLNTIDGLFIAVVNPMPSGTRITGNFSSTVKYAEVANVQTLLFNNDGTFKVKTMGAITTSQTSAIATKTNGGTYSISGNTLHLNYDNGLKTIAVIGIFGTGNTSYLVINDGFFERPR